jgi:methionyl-tRNA formyltransferase
MANDTKLRVVLCALTGFGNTVLDALLADTRVDVQGVFTVKYDRPYPYYIESQLSQKCAELGVACNHDMKVSSNDGLALLHEYSPHLVIVATFKQILSEDVLNIPKLGVINFHPSLLPKYRGPCPTNAALLNDEKVAGLTVHYVTSIVDEGDILLQRSIPVCETEDDGQLRKRLANLAREMVPAVIGMFSGDTTPRGIPQDHRLATFAPKPKVEDGYLELETDIDTIRNKIRALNPLPGTSILVGDRRIAINRFELFQDGRKDGVYTSDDCVEVIIESRAIRLYRSDRNII